MMAGRTVWAEWQDERGVRGEAALTLKGGYFSCKRTTARLSAWWWKEQRVTRHFSGITTKRCSVLSVLSGNRVIYAQLMRPPSEVPLAASEGSTREMSTRKSGPFPLFSLS